MIKTDFKLMFKISGARVTNKRNKHDAFLSFIYFPFYFYTMKIVVQLSTIDNMYGIIFKRDFFSHSLPIILSVLSNISLKINLFPYFMFFYCFQTHA